MDDGLKQRLIGAIVLVAIAVLFLPSLFSRDARRTVDLSSQIPPEPAQQTELLEIAEPTRPENIAAARPLEENYPHEPVPETVTESPKPDNSGPAEPEAEPPVLNEEGVPDAWSLQVASFQSDERAQTMRQRLQDQGYKSYIREAATDQGSVHRVFVGPKIDRAVVEAEKREIDQRFEINSLVVEFKP